MLSPAMYAVADASALPVRRPGGLTALGVLNIIFALLGMLGGLAMTTLRTSAEESARIADQMDFAAEHQPSHNEFGGDPELTRAMSHGMASQMRNTSPTAYRMMMATGYLGGILLLLAGFGLLGQRRYLGRYMGIAAGAVLTVCAGITISSLGILFWGIPLLGGGYALTMGLIAHFMYRPVLQR